MGSGEKHGELIRLELGSVIRRLVTTDDFWRDMREPRIIVQEMGLEGEDANSIFIKWRVLSRVLRKWQFPLTWRDAVLDRFLPPSWKRKWPSLVRYRKLTIREIRPAPPNIENARYIVESSIGISEMGG